MLPCPLVRKNRSASLFQLISFTSNLNCSSARGLCVFTSINVTRSSLLPTAIVWPSGDQHTLMFSPAPSSLASLSSAAADRNNTQSVSIVKQQCCTFCCYSCHWFTRPGIPETHSFVTRCSHQEVSVRRMPAQLIYAVCVSTECIVFWLQQKTKPA